MARKHRTTRYAIDVRDVRRELGRLREAPDEVTLLEFEAIMAELFARTQAVVHIQTGSLLASGKLDTSHKGQWWRGQITYGGASEGSVHDPVRYAEFERERGGAHDFMWPTDTADGRWLAAMLFAIRGAEQ